MDAREEKKIMVKQKLKKAMVWIIISYTFFALAVIINNLSGGPYDLWINLVAIFLTIMNVMVGFMIN